MILDVKVPRDLAPKWISWAERSFAKRAKLPSADIQTYLTEYRLKKLMRALEVSLRTAAIDFILENKLDALRYNGELYVHPITIRTFLKKKFKSYSLSDLEDAYKSPRPLVA